MARRRAGSFDNIASRHADTVDIVRFLLQVAGGLSRQGADLRDGFVRVAGRAGHEKAANDRP